jgi:hypothetical protein
MWFTGYKQRISLLKTMVKPERKAHISAAIDSLYHYLRGVGFTLPADIPPASSPKARAGCAEPARPDPWRGMSNRDPTPTVVE